MPRAITLAFARLLIATIGVVAVLALAAAARTVHWPDGSTEASAATAATFAAEADARVEKARPTTNLGTSSRLASDGSPVEEAFLRFTVAGTTGPVRSARLRLFAVNGTVDGPAVRAAANGWGERTITWNNKPATTGVLADVGAVGANGWLEVDVTAAVVGNGTYTFALASISTDALETYSREGTTRPQLVVATDSEPPPPPPTTTTATTTAPPPPPATTATTTTTAPPQPPPPGTPVPVTAAAETQQVPHGGDAADDAAVWIHPSDPEQSVIIGTDKQGGIAVYDLAGTELSYRPDGNMNNVDLRYNFRLAGASVALAAASDRTHNSLALYRVDPTTRGLVDVAARVITMSPEPYGLCMYRSAATGVYYVFTNDSSGAVRQWELFDAGAGRVDARQVRTFDVGGQTEGCVADDEAGTLFVGEEDVAIWKYGAEPGAGSARTQVDAVGGGRLVADVEGLTLYTTSAGGGYLLASSQGNDSYVVYERGGANAYVLTFAVAAGSVDRVTATDGIDVTNFGLGSRFPEGVFVVQDNTNTGGNQNYKLVQWGTIARSRASGPLAIDPAWDPRAAGR